MVQAQNRPGVDARPGRPTKRKKAYPGTYEAEQQRKVRKSPEPEEPDFINGAPNYDKFKGWDPERVLAWLNID